MWHAAIKIHLTLCTLGKLIIVLLTDFIKLNLMYMNLANNGNQI